MLWCVRGATLFLLKEIIIQRGIPGLRLLGDKYREAVFPINLKSI